MIVTTTPSVEGYRITGYYGIVFGEVITGINFSARFRRGHPQHRGRAAARLRAGGRGPATLSAERSSVRPPTRRGGRITRWGSRQHAYGDRLRHRRDLEQAWPTRWAQRGETQGQIGADERPAAPPWRSGDEHALSSARQRRRAHRGHRAPSSSSRTRSSCSPRRSPASRSGRRRFWPFGLASSVCFGLEYAAPGCRPRPSRRIARSRTHALRAVADGDHRPAGLRAGLFFVPVSS